MSKLSDLIPSGGGLPVSFMNAAYMQWAKQDFANTLEELEYQNGMFEILRNKDKIDSLSDVIISTLENDFFNGEIKLGEMVSRINDTATLSIREDKGGVKITCNNNFSNLYFRVSDNTVGATKGYLYASNGSTLLSTIDVNKKGNFTYNFISGESYYVVIDNDGADFIAGYSSFTTAINGTDFNIVNGAQGTTTISVTGTLRCINDLYTLGGTMPASGSITSTSKDLGFTPSKIIISDEVDLNGESLTYTIEDENSNTVNISRSQLNTEVTLTGITGTEITITVNLSQTGGDTPSLYAYAAYFKE